MSSEISPFSATPDPEMGRALRDVLEPPFHEAFVGRVMARLGQRQAATVDDVLARWFWQGLVAASLALVAAGWGISSGAAADGTDETSVTASASEELLYGAKPASEVYFASLTSVPDQN